MTLTRRYEAAARTRVLTAMLALAAALGGGLGGGLAQTQPTAHEGSLVDEPPPALVSVGVAAGFPAYQAVSASVAIQTEPIGAEVRAGYGGSSIGSIGGVVRGYPPLPGVPVPMWLGAGPWPREVRWCRSLRSVRTCRSPRGFASTSKAVPPDRGSGSSEPLRRTCGSA